MFFASSGVLALTMKTTPFPSVRKYHWSILPARYAFTVSCTSCGMIWARWAGVMGVPMKWEIARIFVVGTGGSGFCAEAAPSGVIGFFMALAPYSSFGILLYGSSVQAGILRLVRGLMSPTTLFAYVQNHFFENPSFSIQPQDERSRHCSIATALTGGPTVRNSATISPFFVMLRPTMTTEAPHSRSPRAIPAPIPPLPPVTRAVLPRRSNRCTGG